MKYSGRIRWIGTIFFLFPALAMARPDWFRELFRNQPAQKEPKAAAVVIRYDANVLCLGSYCNLEMDHSAYGPGTDLHYTWLLLSDGTVVGREKTLTFTPGMESVYGLCAVLEDMGKEVGRDTLQIYVTHVPEYQPVPDTVCYGMEATVGVEGGRYWAWSTGGTTQFVNVRPAETTTYYFRVSEYPVAEYGYENACYAEDSVHVAVLDSAVFTIEGPGGICQGVPVTLEVKGGSDILWNGIPGDARHSFVAERDTGIRVTATDRHGCRDTKEWQIELVDRPEGRIMAYVDGEDVDSVCLGKSVRLEVDSRQADRFRWFTRDTAVSIELEPKSAFLAWCDLFSGPSDQCSTRIQREILVRNCNRVYFANGFVPGGFTKTFGPIGVEDSTRQYYFAVFNRNGTMVFSTTEFSQGWDGRYKGKDAEAGTYVYVFRETYEHFSWTKRGTFTLVR